MGRFWIGTLAISLAGAAMGLAGCSAKAVNDGLALYNSGQHQAALDKWLPLARAGDRDAQNNVGAYYLEVASDRATASQWFLLAAQQGHLKAMTNLARIQLDDGNTEAALSWLILAARWGDSTAMAMLAQRGYQIPSPDLARGAAQQAVNQSTNDVGYALGCALAGGCATPGRSSTWDWDKPSECHLSPYRKDARGLPVVECK